MEILLETGERSVSEFLAGCGFADLGVVDFEGATQQLQEHLVSKDAESLRMFSLRRSGLSTSEEIRVLLFYGSSSEFSRFEIDFFYHHL